MEILNISDQSTLSLVGVGALLTIIGIPMGVILNNLSLFVFWIFPKYFKNGWAKYFSEEYNFHRTMFNDHENVMHVQGRFRYLLGQVHTQGAMFFAFCISGIVSFIFLMYYGFNSWELISIILEAFFAFMYFTIRKYNQKNVDDFIERYKFHTNHCTK